MTLVGFLNWIKVDESGTERIIATNIVVSEDFLERYSVQLLQEGDSTIFVLTIQSKILKADHRPLCYFCFVRV